MVLLNSIKTVHFPIIRCFYWTPSWLNRMVLLNTVNFWKGSKANEILIPMFWEYKLWKGRGGEWWRGSCWRSVSLRNVIGRLLPHHDQVNLSQSFFPTSGRMFCHAEQDSAANSERVWRESKTILQMNYFLIFTVCFPRTRELWMNDFSLYNYIK